MSNVKSKLAEKLETIENDNQSVNAYATVCKEPENLILLKGKNKENNISINPELSISINDAKERLKLLQNFVKEMMIPNVDYGIIPRCDKPTLFKSGAEKLCDIFSFSKHVEVLNRIEDWEKGLFHYEVKAILINKKTGLVESEGIGCCNNKERKFKNQDSYSIVNTMLKIAKKRALIDAVLSATRSSGIFTQDIEDLQDIDIHSSEVINQTADKGNKIISREQQNKIFNIIAQKRLSIDDTKLMMEARYKVKESKRLTSNQAEDFIQFLNKYVDI